MDFRVIFKEPFLEDLERIVKRIAVHDPTAAHKFGNLVVETCERLCFFPERHPRLRQRPNIRRVLIKNFYKVFLRG